jgi:hypothetical protein
VFHRGKSRIPFDAAFFREIVYAWTKEALPAIVNLPQTAEAAGFSLHLARQSTSIHESIVHAWVI